MQYKEVLYSVFAGRMALLITLFLVLVNIFNNVTTNSPKAEGLTAIEIWMLACILFVFGKYTLGKPSKLKTGKTWEKFPNSPAPPPLWRLGTL